MPRILARHAASSRRTGHAASSSVGIRFAAERQMLARLFRVAFALDVHAMGALVGLDILEAALCVAHGVELCARRTAMRGAFYHSVLLFALEFRRD